ncbi:DnaJ family domain-containing protein [candidate division CSSED10-310 bacterium]|uniref:DnaJ family domain-containing protein n=1 Tax=candidate division CSSED10-310 bacterium TaxID=2855610 RepID=A0ABV6YTZ2_UNCC1
MTYFNRRAERLIREALARGDLENLPGKGKPIDLSEYFKTPEKWRIAYDILKSAGYIPEEMELKKEIENLKQKLQTSSDSEKDNLSRVLNETSMQYNMLMERYKKKK